MNVIFRADSSFLLGSGHIIRCLTLADLLYKKDCNILFITRDLPGNFNNSILNKGYSVELLSVSTLKLDEKHCNAPTFQDLVNNWEIDAWETKSILLSKKQNIDCLIVDHYALDIKWERILRPLVKKILVIDDLADRFHDCDYLLDQNYYENAETRYINLVPKYCIQFLGPKYALLRKEFDKAKNNLKERDGVVHRILVFFGGTDPTNETLKALKAIQHLNNANLHVDVVVGRTNPHQEEIKQFCSFLTNTNYYNQVDNMAELMSQADFAIGAGGTTTWERCYLGLPSLTIIIASNQIEVTQAVASAGATWNIGLSSDITVEHLSEVIREAINNPKMLQQMSNNAIQLMGLVFKNQNNIIHAVIGENDATV